MVVTSPSASAWRQSRYSIPSRADALPPRTSEGGGGSIVGWPRAVGASRPASFDVACRVACARCRGRPVGGRAHVRAVQRVHDRPFASLDVSHGSHSPGRRVPRHRRDHRSSRGAPVAGRDVSRGPCAVHSRRGPSRNRSARRRRAHWTDPMRSPGGLPGVVAHSADELQVGQPVVALGSPLGLTSTVTSGIVSALNRYVRVPAESGQTAHRVGAVQTDASINPGNSGGALVDCHARLVGINTAGAALPSTPGGSIGLGFAIPVDFARGIADELIASGKVTRPGFGLQVQPISGGLFVQAVTAGGPADKAGLRPGDVIVEVDGEPAESIDPLVVKTLEMQPGDTVDLTYERGGRHTTTLTLSAG